MRAAFALSVAALAGHVFATPVVQVVYETAVKTVYVTEGYAVTTPSPVAPVYEQAVPTTSSKRRTRTRKVWTTAVPIVYNPAPTSQMVYETPVVVTPVVTPIATPTPVVSKPPVPTSAAPAPSTGYMGVVSEWRSKLGLKALTQDALLESNAMDCVKSSAGVMKHKLNEGSMGQVLAPGQADEFEHVFVGGWLCEISTLPGLNGICKTASEGWAYAGQTGHAEILTSPAYSKIGCALYDGIWGCDLA